MDIIPFCNNFIFHNGRPIAFDGRPYLPAIYGCVLNLVLCCSRQVEKSTFVANSIIYQAITQPYSRILFVAPREDQARIFSHTRLIETIERSPLIRRMLLGTKGRPAIKSMRFHNGSQVFIRAAYRTADACRGLSADTLYVDEFQDAAPGMLPVLAETLSHSARKRIVLTGTPKDVANHLETILRRSTACQWRVPCPGCKAQVVLDDRVLGLSGPQCPTCSAPLDPAKGLWVPRNPGSTWGAGFTVNHLMVPWLNHDEILQRQVEYDPVKFKNEVLGIPTALGDHVVTRAELEACCTPTAMITSLAQIPAAVKPRLMMGIDWGGGVYARTVAVIGAMDAQFNLHVIRFEAFKPGDDPEQVVEALAQLCREFGIRAIAADGAGNGHVWNRLLVNKLQQRLPLYAMLYGNADAEPRQDGVLWKWTVGRSRAMGNVFARVKKKSIFFPAVADVSSYLEEIACEIAEYDDEQRSIRYTHPEGQPDDALHALTYLLAIAIRAYHAGGAAA